jgi:hypothetical protein
MKRFLLLLAAAVASAAFYATPALADGTVSWNGANGADNNTPCVGEEEPGLHWVFTPGGQNSVTAATLTVNGSEVVPMAQSGDGSWAADSSGSSMVTSAKVDYAGTAGENANLTLSHGCFTAETSSPPPPPPPPGPQPPPPPPPGGGAGGTPPAPPAPLAPPPPPATTGGALPFTGLPVWIPLLAGGLLLGAGLSLMRRGRSAEH